MFKFKSFFSISFCQSYYFPRGEEPVADSCLWMTFRCYFRLYSSSCAWWAHVRINFENAQLKACTICLVLIAMTTIIFAASFTVGNATFTLLQMNELKNKISNNISILTGSPNELSHLEQPDGPDGNGPVP